MSKFLKFIVNTILILSIVVAGGLLVPPFVGVTTVIVDDVSMNTNLAKGSVTYALDKNASDLKEGNKLLINENGGQYLYKVTAINGENVTLEDQLSIDSQIQEKTFKGMVKKVVFTVPLIGYVSMALRTTEGLIIVGLAVVFVIILFILSEIWKKDEDEDDEEDNEEESTEEAEEPQMSRREQKKALKAERKEAKRAEKEAKKALKKAKKNGETEEEAPEAILQQESENLTPKAEIQEEEKDVQQNLFDEVGSVLAADVADMMQEKEETVADDTIAINMEETQVIPVLSEEVLEEEIPEEKKLAMPIYTREELLEKAKKAGEEPKVTEDEYSGVTLLDYSDLL